MKRGGRLLTCVDQLAKNERKKSNRLRRGIKNKKDKKKKERGTSDNTKRRGAKKSK
jgi:hypothetical protein